MRRTLPVPIVAAGRQARPVPRRRSGRPVATGRRKHDPVARILARQAAATPSPSGSTTGRSFALCTARSTSPRRQRVFELLHELALAVVAGNGPVLRPIAGRRDDDDLAPRRQQHAADPRRRAPARVPAGCRGLRSGARCSACRLRRRAAAQRRRPPRRTVRSARPAAVVLGRAVSGTSANSR